MKQETKDIRDNNNENAHLQQLSAERDLRKNAENAFRGQAVPRAGIPSSNIANNKRMAANSLQKHDDLIKRQKGNNAKKIYNLKQMAMQKMIEQYAKKNVSGRKTNASSSEAEELLNAMSSRKNSKLGLGGLNKGAKSKDASTDKPEEDKSAQEKDQEKRASEIKQGIINFALSIKTIKWIVIIAPIVAFVFLFLIVCIAVLNDDKVSSMLLGVASSSKNGQELSELVTEVRSGNGDQPETVAVGMGDVPNEYYDRLSSLGNLYTSQATCKGEECLKRPEFLYYLKVADINMRYKNKYHVDLDWALIVATDLYFASSTEETMRANLSNYNKDTVTDYNSWSELDWDNDYTKVDGYQYLDADDSRYDLNILAKNMVTKKTNQTCVDSDGKVVSSQEDIDVEEQYFQDSKKLKCGSGQTYSITNSYVLDKKKYDEFLLEYIDKKMYSKGTGKENVSNDNPSSSVNSSTGNSLASAFVNLALAQKQDPSAQGGEKYWRYMGFESSTYWCACFVSWVIEHTSYGGQNLKDIIKKQTAAVAVFMNYFYQSNDPNIKFYFNDNCPKWKDKNGGLNYIPKEGDLIFFAFNSSRQKQKWDGTMPTQHQHGASHVGIVQRVENGKIITIEGNTGDAVREQSYSLDSDKVIAFGSWY